jgi:hypothetical protein
MQASAKKAGSTVAQRILPAPSNGLLEGGIYEEWLKEWEEENSWREAAQFRG